MSHQVVLRNELTGCLSNVLAPPVYTQFLLDQLAPGVWSFFLGAANSGLGGLGAVRVTSWWRTVSRNRSVGGHPESQHLVGTAADACTSDNARAARQLAQRGLIAIDEGDHVHFQVWPAGTLARFGILDRVGV